MLNCRYHPDLILNHRTGYLLAIEIVGGSLSYYRDQPCTDELHIT